MQNTSKHFKDFDFSHFWNDDEYALKEYVSDPPSDELIQSVEEELGYKLPESYIELIKMHNGGRPHDFCLPTQENIGWAEDHIAITGIFGIGREKKYSLCGSFGSQFWVDHWEYPNIGIYICSTPTGGHDMVALDYRKCGKNGEPEVVFVSQEHDYEIHTIAKNFETFIRSLVNEKVFDTSEEDRKEDVRRIENGKFSGLLQELCSDQNDFPKIDQIIRNLSKKIVEEKGYFALHDDEFSYLMYDLQFWLYTNKNKVKSKEDYLEIYPKMIACGDGEFGTGGYAPDFVKEWMESRMSQGLIIEKMEGLCFSEECDLKLKKKLLEYKE